MKNFSPKKLLSFAGIALGMVVLSSCTANFCSASDQASIAYPYEQGATVYVTKAQYDQFKTSDEYKVAIEIEEQWSNEAKALGIPAIAGPAFVDGSGNAIGDVYKFIPASFAKNIDADGNLVSYVYTDFTLSANKAAFLQQTIRSGASSNGYYTPSLYYYGIIDDLVLKAATIESYAKGAYVDQTTYATKLSDSAFVTFLTDNLVACDDTGAKYSVNPYGVIDPAAEDEAALIDNGKSVLRENGRIKFSGSDGTLYGYLDSWNSYIREEIVPLGFSQIDAFSVAGTDYMKTYKDSLNSKFSSIRSCIATRSGYFGHYGTNSDWRVAIEQKDWGYAWGKGFLEGLLVYPVSWLVDTLAFSIDPVLSGTGQILALLIVTLIVRGLLMVFSFRSTLDSQRMQALQPEIAKIQAKYPNANTNQAEKQRLSQEQMALYKRHKIKPFSQILMLFIQFPVFISVWSGLQGASTLSTGEVLNLRLSDNLNTILTNFSGAWYTNENGWWTAAILFVLMALAQVAAMLLPMLFGKLRSKNVVKTSKNPAQDQQAKTMKTVQIVMVVFTIFMGFMLPSAMGVYWFISALISMIQSGITQIILAKNSKKKGKKQ